MSPSSPSPALVAACALIRYVTANLIDEAKQNIDGDLIYFFVRGGDDGMSYKFTCSVVGVLGSRYEAEATMLVRDK